MKVSKYPASEIVKCSGSNTGLLQTLTYCTQQSPADTAAGHSSDKGSFDNNMVLADLGRKLNAAFSSLSRAPVVDEKVCHICIRIAL